MDIFRSFIPLSAMAQKLKINWVRYHRSQKKKPFIHKQICFSLRIEMDWNTVWKKAAYIIPIKSGETAVYISSLYRGKYRITCRYSQNIAGTAVAYLTPVIWGAFIPVLSRVGAIRATFTVMTVVAFFCMQVPVWSIRNGLPHCSVFGGLLLLFRRDSLTAYQQKDMRK